MDMEKLVKQNSHLLFYTVFDKEFLDYGRVIDHLDFSSIEEFMKATEIPEEGNIYVRSSEEMEATNVYTAVSQSVYGGMDIQIGYCNGRNSHLNGLEYHKSSEVNVALTDFVLLLGKVQEIENNRFDVKNVKAFYVPKGSAVEMYATTLHFAPCKVTQEGFKCLVILPEGTNAPLELAAGQNQSEDQLLFMKNKWLLAHPERKQLIEKGAFPGIIGENIEIIFD